jgi:hypothetical protein
MPSETVVWEGRPNTTYVHSSTKMITSTTPTRISDEIRAFCADIDPTQIPVYVQVRPATQAKINSYFDSVLDHATQKGGAIQYGWIIWEELSNNFLEAEFHAVWVSSSRELIDITPKIDNEATILFLPDSKRVYKGRLVENRRKLLVVTDLTLQWIWFGHNCYLIKSKHFLDGKVDEQSANKELAQWTDLQQRAGAPKFHATDSCPCGSVKKLKRCCGRKIKLRQFTIRQNAQLIFNCLVKQ